MGDERAKPIPPGLTRCPVCSEYRGSTLARHLNWNATPYEPDEVILVRCICDGILCRRCGKKMHRPISNYYDEEANKIWHVPYFMGMFPCRECLSSRD